MELKPIVSATASPARIMAFHEAYAFPGDHSEGDKQSALWDGNPAKKPIVDPSSSNRNAALPHFTFAA